MKTEHAVKERYAAASRAQEPALCCPVDYNPEYLKAIPAEVIERDYGCGDPSKHVHPGETVLDLGSDEPVPEHLQNDPDLWSGCISGALTEEDFLKAFEDAGFYGIEILKFDIEPWQTVEGIEFRSMTVQAFKGKQGPGVECNQAVVYRGPFKEVLDDDGHRLVRGVRHAVCDKTFSLYKKAPYAGFFDFIEPIEAVPTETADPFDCARTDRRHPKETKGQEYRATTTTANSQCCDGGSCC